MRTALLLALMAPFCCAQTIPVESLFQPASLSGTWKHQIGDDPRWADPAFDDSAWPGVRMPEGAVQPGNGFSWYRFRVRLPQTMPSEPLALMIGGFGSSQAYEVFWNGQRIGSAGEMDGRGGGLVVPAPRVFRIPAPVRDAVLAIRLRSATMPFAYPLDPDHRRTWLGAQQPVGALVEVWRGDRLRGAQPQLLIAASLLIPGFLFFLLQLWRREANEYFWFGLWLICSTSLRVLQVYPEALGIELSLVSSWAVALGKLGSILLFSTLVGVLFQGKASTTVRVTVGTLMVLVLSQILMATSGRSLPVSFADGADTVIMLSIGFVYYELGWRTAKAADKMPGVHAATIAYIASMGFTYATALVWRNESFHNASVFVRTAGLLLFSFAMAILMNQRSARLLGERQRLSGELASAAEVQSLLLTSLPTAGDLFRIYPVYLPASEVGGDFYQVLERPDGARVVLVGDVSGKGLKAAMLVSVTVGMLRRESSSSPAQILNGLNEGLIGRTGGGFVTCCCVRFDADGTVTIANAGHPSPYCDGREVEVEAGLPLGIAAGVEYSELVMRGERLTLVSDGVVEAENAQRELFGFDRTREISTKSAQEIAEAAKAWGQNDDITVVTVRRAEC